MSLACASSSHCHFLTLARLLRAGVQLSRLLSGGKVVHNGHLDRKGRDLSHETHAYRGNLFRNIHTLSFRVVKAQRVNKMHLVSSVVHKSILLDINGTLYYK